MKRFLAYSFLLITTLAAVAMPFAARAQNMNQYVHEQVSSKENEVVLKLISNGKPGYYNADGKEIKSTLDIRATGELRDGINGEGPADSRIYYKTDGKLVYKYWAGNRGVVDATESNTVYEANDRVMGVFYNYDAASVRILKADNTVNKGDEFSFAPGSEKDKEFLFAVANNYNLQGSAKTAAEYESLLNKSANQAAFGVGPTPRETALSQNAIPKMTNTVTMSRLQLEIGVLDNQIAALPDGPEKTAKMVERAAKAAELARLQDDQTKNAASLATYEAGVKGELQKLYPPTFVGIEICVQIINPAERFIPFVGKTIGENIRDCMGGVANFLMELASYPFIVVVSVLDYAAQFTIIDFSSHLAETSDTNSASLYEPVYSIWQLIKNICNLFFIGALLYIAVTTILNADGFQERKRLINVIIFAILINFSMFFTKLLIDISNTATVQVFNVITASTAQSGSGRQLGLSVQPVPGAVPQEKLLSGVFLNSMQIQKFVGENSNGGLFVGNYQFSYIIVYALLSVIFILTATVILGAVAGTLITRFVVLIILLMTSPIAYIGSFTPGAIGEYSKLWWSKLKDNLIFMPVLMIMFYITMNFAKFTADTVSKSSNNYYALVFSYIITISMLVISLAVAKSVGGTSAGAKWGARIGGALSFGLLARAGRRTLGYAGRSATRWKWLRRAGANTGLVSRFTTAPLARLARNAGQGLRTSTFDARNTEPWKKYVDGDAGLKGGYDKVEEEREKLAKEQLKMMKEMSEATAQEKIRAEVAAQHDRAEKSAKEAEEHKKKVQEEHDEVSNKLKPGGLEAHVDGLIDEEVRKIDSEMAKNLKRILEHENTSKDASITPEERDAARRRADQVRKENDDLDTKRKETFGKRDKMLVDEEKDLRKKLKGFTEALDTATKNVADSEKEQKRAKQRVIDMGYSDADALKVKVKSDKDTQKERSAGYLDHLESGLDSGFQTAEFNKVYREEYAKALKDLYKSKNAQELKKALDELKKSIEGDDKDKDKDKDKGKGK